MRIAIVGHGFVGKAIEYGFPETHELEKVIIDPKLGTDIGDLGEFVPDVVFVSVPTPMGDHGQIDSSIIEQVVEDLRSVAENSVVVVKSTVTPDILEYLDDLHPRMVYNPEFLSERNANFDFVNPPMLVLGGKQKDVEFVEKLYADHSICEDAPVFKTDYKTASLVKYTINSFLATKVTFFNGIKEIFDTTGTESGWDMFTYIVSTDKRIGSTHMQVPGPDGKTGFGGSCFTKDTAALISYARELRCQFEQLEETIRINNGERSKYELDEREKEQHVSYNTESLNDR